MKSQKEMYSYMPLYEKLSVLSKNETNIFEYDQWTNEQKFKLAGYADIFPPNSLLIVCTKI